MSDAPDSRTEPTPSEGEVEAAENAMTAFWNEWCSDTGCVPEEFRIAGPHTTRVYADFSKGKLATAALQAAFQHPEGTVAKMQRVVVEAAKPIRSFLAASYKCPCCGNNGMGHASESCPSLVFQNALAALEDK